MYPLRVAKILTGSDLMKKGLAAIILVVGMTMGSALTMVLNPVGAASALVGNSSTSTSGHQNILQQALSTLVGNGTITQKQSDAVTQQVQNLQKQHPRPSFRGGMRGMGPGLAMLGRDGMTQLATLLKTDPKTLLADLQGGKSIADVAKANGVDINTVIATLEKDANSRIQEQVTDGHLTQDQATKIENGLATMITRLVNQSFSGFGFGFGGPMGPSGSNAPAGQPATPPTPRRDADHGGPDHHGAVRLLDHHRPVVVDHDQERVAGRHHHHPAALIPAGVGRPSSGRGAT